MKTTQITLDFARITDWPSFHAAFQEAMGFPAFYGSNMDAWIDCMSCIDDPGAGMSAVTVKAGDSLELVVRGTDLAARNCPEVWLEFLECTAFVNRRFIESDSATRLKLIAA